MQNTLKFYVKVTGLPSESHFKGLCSTVLPDKTFLNLETARNLRLFYIVLVILI